MNCLQVQVKLKKKKNFFRVRKWVFKCLYKVKINKCYFPFPCTSLYSSPSQVLKQCCKTSSDGLPLAKNDGRIKALASCKDAKTGLYSTAKTRESTPRLSNYIPHKTIANTHSVSVVTNTPNNVKAHSVQVIIRQRVVRNSTNNKCLVPKLMSAASIRVNSRRITILMNGIKKQGNFVTHKQLQKIACNLISTTCGKNRNELTQPQPYLVYISDSIDTQFLKRRNNMSPYVSNKAPP